jgi:hypothetical protein
MRFCGIFFVNLQMAARGMDFFCCCLKRKVLIFFPVELEIINLAMEKGLVEKKEQFFGIF